MFYENRFVTDFNEETELFNSFFSGKCSLILNNSSLPSDVRCLTDKCLSTVIYSAEDIRKIIINLNSENVHRHNYISVLMLKTCHDSTCASLEIIFTKALLTGAVSL